MLLATEPVSRDPHYLFNELIRLKEEIMIRTACAIAVASFLVTSISGVAHAAPVAPLPAGVSSGALSGNVVKAWCGWRCGHRAWGYHRYYGYAPAWRGGGWCRWHPARCGW